MRSFWRLSFQKFVSSVGWKCVLLREKAKSSHHNCVVRPKHWPTMNQKISVERKCLYLSFGNLFFQICPSKTLQWPLENQVPLGAMANKGVIVYILYLADTDKWKPIWTYWAWLTRSPVVNLKVWPICPSEIPVLQTRAAGSNPNPIELLVSSLVEYKGSHKSIFFVTVYACQQVALSAMKIIRSGH